MNFRLKSIITICLVIPATFLVDYYVNPIWVARSVVLLLLTGCGFLLRPHLALIPGIFTIPGDLLLMVQSASSSGSPTATDFLFWALLIALPYGLSNAINEVDRASDEEDSDESDEVTSRTAGPVERNASGPTRTSDVEPEDHEAFERLQWLVKHRLQDAHSNYGFDVLLLYDVEQKEASLSYAIDPDNVVNRETTFQADTGQGIGWVLRHGEELVQTEQNIDWRNLQYRTQPGNLERVKMVPLYHDERMSGILVMEWEAGSAHDRQLDGFIDEVAHLMALRREIHQLEKNQNLLELMERLHELNPLEETKFDNMIHRSIEIVRSFIPVNEGHVEYFSYSEDSSAADVVHQGRRAVYEECMKWIKESEEILRIADLSNHRLGQQAQNRFGQDDLRSFLGGAVKKDGQLVGMICLDHPQPDYFTKQDAELLRILLDQLSQVLRVGRRLDRMERKQSEYRQLLDVLQVGEVEQSVQTVIDRQVEQLREHLPLISAGYYEYQGGEYHRVSYRGDGEPSERFGRDHAMIRRIKNAESLASMLSFPDLNRFEGYEAPLDADGLKVIPINDGQRLAGFFTLFVNDADKLDDDLFEEVERVLPLMTTPLRLMYQKQSVEDQNKRDPVTDLPRFETWKSSLSRRIEDEAPDGLVTWFVRVPGYEEIAEERGRDRARNWLRSVSKLLDELLERSEFTRSYAGTFVGFEPGPAEKIEDRLTTVADRLSSWSFPTGEWPRSPKCGFTRFSPPFPNARKLIDAPFKRGRSESSVDDGS